MFDGLESLRRRLARRWARRVKLALLAAFLSGPIVAVGLLATLMHVAAADAGIVLVPALALTAIVAALYAFDRWLSASSFATR